MFVHERARSSTRAALPLRPRVLPPRWWVRRESSSEEACERSFQGEANSGRAVTSASMRLAEILSMMRRIQSSLVVGSIQCASSRRSSTGAARARPVSRSTSARQRGGLCAQAARAQAADSVWYGATADRRQDPRPRRRRRHWSEASPRACRASRCPRLRARSRQHASRCRTTGWSALFV